MDLDRGRIERVDLVIAYRDGREKHVTLSNNAEGPVTLSVPAKLSEESYEDLEAQLTLFLRRAKRRAGKGEETN